MAFRSIKTKLVGNFYSWLFTLILVVVGVLGMFPNTVFSAFNSQINYQGKLTDNLNASVADGNYTMVFSLYTSSTGGVALWTETQTITATSGLFSTMLGSVTPISSVDFNQTLYLGVKVGADPEMTPRKILGAVPAAFEADKLDGLDATSFLRADATNAIATITSATTTNFYTSIFNAVSGTITNLLGTKATITSATTTDLYTSIFTAISGWFTNLIATNATTTNATSTNFYVSGNLINSTLTGLAEWVGGLAGVTTTPTIDGLTLNGNLNFNATSSIYSVDNDLVFQDANGGAKTLSQLIAGPGGCSQANTIISGGQATYSGTGFVYDVPATVYCIGGLQYSIASTQVTLDAADSVADRIDIIAVNSSSQAVGVTGATSTDSTNPIAPALNPDTQLELTFVYIKAGATMPGEGGSGPQQEFIYRNNVEWTGTQSFPSGGVVDFSSTVDPQAGANNIEVTTPLTRNGYFQFSTSTAVWDPTGYTYLSFYIKNKTAWTSTSDRLNLTWRNNLNNQLGGIVSIQHNTYGFDKNNITSYQKITIPLSTFGTLGTSIKYLRFTTSSGSASNTFNFRVDGIIAEGPSSGGATPTTGLSGAGLLKQITFWTGTSTMAGSNSLVWDSVNNRLGIGTSSPTTALEILGTASSTSLYTTNFTLANLTGILKATAGVISTALVNLTTDITGTLGIGNGGTNATSFATNLLTYFDGTRLTSTSSPTVGYLVATSTTGTSTFAGHLSIDGKVGIGTTTPNTLLAINATNATTDFLRLASSTNQNILVVDKNGNMGIGSSTPSEKLVVNGALTIGTSAGADAALGTLRWNGTDLQVKATTTANGWSSLTSSNEIDMFLIAGQSNAAGAAPSGGAPDPIAGTAYQYYLGTISDAADTTTGAFGGSAWSQFAITYY